ncbi:hypothetical protein N5S93_09025 [Aliarcobacter cryaerophilus]|uniref:capsular polysaccharide export protein, LipB/KpsS family n=1 Tax=Aliarcobacter cryaerophilus TaxID=28198 RepID=UPI0021B34787|nr:hypothetical protein [Aliarcobacter cryaerophilus]MCT7495758.1 hypothetical protein [Aliarcobacter cryaerophilus]
MKIFVYAFANTALFFNEVFIESQKNQDDIEWGIIYPGYSYKDSSKNIIKEKNIFYLYQEFNNYFYNKNRKNIEYSYPYDSDNIHRMIDGSKHGYKRYNRYKQEKNANIIYELYKNYLLGVMPDYIIFPDLEVVDGLILLNICKELNIEILYSVDTRLFGKSFFAKDYYETLPDYYGKINEIDIYESKMFIKDFSDKRISAFNVRNYGTKYKKVKIPSIYIRFFRGLYYKYKYERNAIIETTLVTKLMILLPNFHKLYRIIKYKFLQKHFFLINSKKEKEIPENFILYPLQMTPESSINTLEQYFIDQEKLIDMIRLNMPNNFYLLVKEHPVMIGFRDTQFYKRVANKSGVMLVDPQISTIKLIELSKLVITITGTVGLESYLNSKRVLMFGPTFFSHLCSRFDSYLNLRNTLYELIFNVEKNSENKIIDIAKINNISYDFILNDPLFYPEVMSIANIANFIDSVKTHIKRIQNV